MQLLKPTSYNAITHSLPTLVSVAIVSKYPDNIFNRCSVDSNLQKHIETLVYEKYISKTDIDISPYSKILCLDKIKILKKE